MSCDGLVVAFLRCELKNQVRIPMMAILFNYFADDLLNIHSLNLYYNIHITFIITYYLHLHMHVHVYVDVQA